MASRVLVKLDPRAYNGAGIFIIDLSLGAAKLWQNASFWRTVAAVVAVIIVDHAV